MARISSLEEFIELLEEKYGMSVDENDSLEDLEIDLDDFLEYLEFDLGLEDMDRVSFEVKEDSKVFAIYNILFI